MDSPPRENATPSIGMLQPAPSTGLSYSTDILKIEQEIEHHAQIIVNLKIKRNSRLPISRLPVEILCRIFEHAQYAWPESTYGSSRDSAPAWLAVTRVCQHWRNAALNEPFLWTKPPFGSEKWTPIFLERARMAGVDLVFDERSPMPMRENHLATLTAHIPHTTTFTARHIPKEAMRTLVNNLRSTVAPMLEKLTIDNTPPMTYFRIVELESDDTINISLPDTAFLGATKLRHLSLVGINIPWNSHLLSSLTSLTLEMISKDTRPTPAELLSTLERNPDVRTLTLRDVFPSAGRLASIPPRRPRIPLLSLETLNVSCAAVDFESLLSHVTLGDNIEKVSATLEYDSDTTANRPLFKLLSILDEAISGQRLGSRSRHVTIDGVVGDFHITTMPLSFFTGGKERKPQVSWPTTKIPLPPFVPDNGALDLHLALRPTSPPSANLKEISIGIFSDFFHGLHWDNLSELLMTDLRVYADGFDTVLARTFGTLPRLRTIVVGTSNAHHLVTALLLHSDKDPALFPNSIPFPGLQHITFVGVTFDLEDEEEEDEDEDEDAYTTHITMGRLLDCLMDRCERGVELHSVSIEHCRSYGTYEQELLEEVVVDVKWDGHEIFSDDEGEDEDEDEEDYEEYEEYEEYYHGDSDVDYADYDDFGLRHGGAWY